MKNIIRAQLYQMRRRKFIGIVFVVIFIMIGFNFAADSEFGKGITASEYFVTDGILVLIMSLIYALFFTGEVCGGDFMDKTINYEVLGGCTRKTIYASRVLLSLAGGCTGTVLLWTAPLAVGTFIWGWGDTLPFPDMLCRFLLALFPLMRLICEFVFFSCIVKNSYIVMGVGTFLSLASQSLEAFSGKYPFAFLGFTNLYRLFSLEAFRVYTLNDLRFYIIYETELSASHVIQTIGMSCGAGVLFLWLGYLYFCRDDLN